MKFDEIIQRLGDFGTFQKRIYVLICILGTTCSILAFLPVFLVGVPNHRCAIPGFDNDTYLPQDAHHLGLINHTIPPNPQVDEEPGVPYDRCNVYVSEDNKTTHACNKWVYEKTTFTVTFVSQENLVCDMKWTQSLVQMIYFAGLLVGSIAIGTFSDIFGRKKGMLVSYVFHITSGFAIIWAPNFATFAVMRFLTGVSVMGMFLSLYVLVMEYVGPSKRVWAGIVVEFFFPVGMVILVGVAYFLREWNYLQLAMTVPSVFYISYFWILPESPRWLVSKGRLKEAGAIIRRAAVINRVTLPDEIFDDKSLDESQAGENMFGIFKSKVLILRSLIIFFNWFVITMGYYGLTMNSGSLSGNLFLDFLLSSLVEFPAYVLTLFGLDRFGRRKLHCAVMIIGGAACIATIFPVLYADRSLNWITITLAMIGKFGISAAFAIIYVYTVELFPTIVRNSGIGASSMCARVGGMIGPYIVNGGRAVGGHFGTALPLLVFGVLMLVAGLLSLFLPETLNKKLPETFYDAIQFGRRDYSFNNNDNGKPVEEKQSAAHVNKSFTPDDLM